MNEVLILSMILAAGLAVMGFKFRSVPLLVISSLGWVLVSLELYDAYAADAMLPMALLWMVAFSQILMGAKS